MQAAGGPGATADRETAAGRRSRRRFSTGAPEGGLRLPLGAENRLTKAGETRAGVGRRVL